MTRSSTRKSKTAASAARTRRRTRKLKPRDEPEVEKFFDFGEGHTARILTPDEIVAIADGRDVPPRSASGYTAGRVQSSDR